MVVRNTQAATEIQILQSDAVGFQFQNELAEAPKSLFERTHFGNLRSQVALHPDDLDIGQPSGISIKLPRFRKAHAEFVFLHAS